MHVVLCYSIYPPIQAGGAELIVAYLAEELAQRGHRVTVISTCGPEMEPYPTERRNGVEVIRFFPRNRYWLFDRAGRGGIDKLRWHLRDAWNRAGGRRLREIMAEQRPDVVHTHGVEGFSPIIWRVAQRLGIPVVHTAHDYYMLCPRALLLTRKLALCNSPGIGCRARSAWYLHVARAIDLFCSPSQFLLEKHLAAGLATRRHAVIPNGVPVPVIEARRPDGARRGALRLLFAGRLTAEKGIRVLLEAMQRLPREVAVELTIAGKGVLESEVRWATGRDPRIRYVGYLSGEEKHAAFLAADCLALPSLWYENAPVVILEAAAYRIAVLGSRLGAIPEFVTDGLNGLLFVPGDPESLAAAIGRLAVDERLLASLKVGGGALLARHSIAQMVDGYLSGYRQLVAAPDGPTLAPPAIHARGA